ncbi:MAG: CHAP domain-containing protein [Actinomycetota bacterium]|nr:CHAP domain-containing protein [Actinomycetota bacterium]
MTTAGQIVVSIARAELERGVREIPDGSNTSPRIREYQAATWLPGTGWPWCLGFANWVAREAGYPFPFPSAGAYDFLARGKKAGWATSTPRVGAVAIFNVGAGHGAIVEKYDAATVTTIDGNVGNRVSRNTRSRSSVRGYVIHPRLASGPVPVVKVPKKAKRVPWYEIVSSSGGKKHLVVSGRPYAQLVAFLPRVLARWKNIEIRRTR